MDSKFFLSLELVRKIVFNLPELDGVSVNKKKGTLQIHPDSSTIITIDINAITMKNNEIKIPVDGKRKLPIVPDIHLSGNLLITNIQLKKNNSLFFDLSVDDLLIKAIIGFLRGYFPDELEYLDNDKYKVNLSRFIPEPYDNITITKISFHDGIEVNLC